MRLKNQVAIVTGAARGLGKAFSIRLASEGAKVIATDKADVSETIKEIKAAGGDALGLRVDVTNEDSTLQMAQSAIDTYGKIDILVNNAAIYGGLRFKPIEEVPADEWDAVMSVNVKGVWLCCKAVVPYMKKQNSGSIINISSAAVLSGMPELGHYVTSKGAVWAHTRSLARELGNFNIRVNSIMPGYTMTEGSLDLSDDPEFMKAVYHGSIAQRIFKKEQTAYDLEGTVVFLASQDSAFITGQNINVDGGMFHY